MSKIVAIVFCLSLVACLSSNVNSAHLSIGMTADQVVAAIGEPDRKSLTTVQGHLNEEWFYSTRRLYFVDGLLDNWTE